MPRLRVWVLGALLLGALLLGALLLGQGIAVAATPEEVIGQTAPKLVKLYGTGGFRGLEGYGTGFLCSAEGHVATSWGPLLDNGSVTAVLDDGRRFEANVVGADPGHGLAVLKLRESPGSLPHFDLAQSPEVSGGERFLAFSNMFRVAAGDEPVSVMHGMVLSRAPLDARRGRYEVNLDTEVYFLDAVTNNPGAAGGIIVDYDGQPLGMIGRELQGELSETWINYAVPVPSFREQVARVVAGEQLDLANRSDEEVTPVPPTAAGLVMVPDVTQRTPAFVSEVLTDTPAEAAGFEPDDLILFWGSRPVRSLAELRVVLGELPRDESQTVIVRRGGGLKTLRITVEP